MCPTVHDKKMSLLCRITVFLLAFGVIACESPDPAPDPTPSRAPQALIVIVDGLRPEYVTPEIMPRLSELRDQGYSGLAHHAVFPTVTRVNSSSISSGSYPQSHGIMGNTMYVPTVADRVLSTGEKQDLDHMEEALEGELLTVPTLGEVMAEHDHVLFAASSGSSGSGYLMNHRLGKGGLVHFEYVLPDTLKAAVDNLIGPAPEGARQPNLHRVRYAIDAILQVGIDYLNADAMLLWVTEPDGTAHANGIGAPETIEALQGVDEEIARMLDELGNRNLLDDINIFFTSDHGFSTHTGQQSIRDLLIEKGLKASEDSRDVVLAGGAIHINEDKSTRLPQIISLLQQTEWVGPVFTRDGHDGTLPFSSVFWNHERSADILTSYNWTDAENEHGYAGEVITPGVAGHGSTSPFDIRTFFAISGPDFKQGTSSEVPSSNVDLAPTVLHLLGLSPAPTMSGRVLEEALVDGPEPGSVQVVEDPFTAETAGYQLILHRSKVGSHTYIDGTQVLRTTNN